MVELLEEASPPLAEALRRHPHLSEDPRADDSVTLRVMSILIDVATADLAGQLGLAETTSQLSDAMDRLVADELARAREAVGERHPLSLELAFAVVAMGKWGARELNYYSDLDMIFVHEPVEGQDNASRLAAMALASKLMASLSAPTFDGPALNVDADLRPEGTMGPLSRSLDGYRTYYQRWSEAWELQALLKARPVAGDPDLGGRFDKMARELVWDTGLDPEALRSIRHVKAQAEASAASTDIKRGRGGIRDIEFAVQVLQLVHGRFDPDLRVPATIDAIGALRRHGYLEPAEANRLSDAYRFLRDVEHRLQLRELRQTHTLPADPAQLEVLGRSLGFKSDPGAELATRMREVRESARDLHERLYFRPILDSLVGVPSARLDPSEASLRLEALGFSDVMAARTALNDLTAGLSRRSRVMHQALPLMLDWLSQSPDPDLGLSQLRLLLANTTDHAALVTLLQTNPLAGERLCLLLGTGRLVGDLLDRIPEFIPRLADDEMIGDIRLDQEATERLIGLLDARPDYEARVGTIRRFVRRRKLRIAARDILGGAETGKTLNSLSDIADAALGGALHMTLDSESFAVIAMGKWGGRELSYGSDIDLMYVHRDMTGERGFEIAHTLAGILSEPNRHGDAYQLDTELRPEGRRGPLSRSLDSYHRYYTEWVEPWELLALTKARPSAGDPHLLADHFEMISPVLWRENVSERVIREIRRIKARVESERIPSGEDPDYHLKLGPGGLSDIEFAVQLLQLRHGGQNTELRVTGTTNALARLHDAGIIGPADFASLSEAYEFLTRVRLRLHLQSGRLSDSLPTDPAALSRLASSLGFDRTGQLRETYRRHARKARRSFERLFFD